MAYRGLRTRSFCRIALLAVPFALACGVPIERVGVVASAFTVTTNAVAEGINDTIAMLQRRAYGFRNLDHFRTTVFFQCGGLRLHLAREFAPTKCPADPLLPSPSPRSRRRPSPP